MENENLEKLSSLKEEEVNSIFSQLTASEIEAILEKVNEEDSNGNN
ncbi:MAG: hypothetical protein IJI60_03910 [Bacilli bacterium]|nr:hypothetical protein [Bacilli bacterium]